jgi:hypothetical protein
MGYVMLYLKKRYGDKWWIWTIDWSMDLIIAATFIYLAWYVRIYMLQQTEVMNLQHQLSKCLAQTISCGVAK